MVDVCFTSLWRQTKQAYFTSSHYVVRYIYEVNLTKETKKIQSVGLVSCNRLYVQNKCIVSVIGFGLLFWCLFIRTLILFISPRLS